MLSLSYLIAGLNASNTGNPQLAQALSELRDIHQPQAVSQWWPLTTAEWVLLVSLPIIITAIVLLHRYLKRKNAALKHALSLLAQAKKQENFHLAANDILKRYCQVHYPQAVALSGQNWVDFLAEQGNFFNQQQSDLFSFGLYQKQVHYDKAELYKSCESWLKNNRPYQGAQHG